MESRHPRHDHGQPHTKRCANDPAPLRARRHRAQRSRLSTASASTQSGGPRLDQVTFDNFNFAADDLEVFYPLLLHLRGIRWSRPNPLSGRRRDPADPLPLPQRQRLQLAAAAFARAVHPTQQRRQEVVPRADPEPRIRLHDRPACHGCDLQREVSGDPRLGEYDQAGRGEHSELRDHHRPAQQRGRDVSRSWARATAMLESLGDQRPFRQSSARGKTVTTRRSGTAPTSAFGAR